MRLLFDLMSTQPVGSSKFHGGGEYGKRLFAEIVGACEGKVLLSACLNPSAYMNGWILDLIREHAVEIIQVGSCKEIVSLINGGNYDRFYSPVPYYLRGSEISTPTQVVGTIHGLRPIEMPTDKYEPALTRGLRGKSRALIKQLVPRETLACRQVNNYKDCVAALDRVVTVSEHSRASIRVWLDRDADIEVRYSVPTTDVAAGEPERDIIAALPKKFVLMVSCDRWLKNPVRGARALDGLFSKNLLPGYHVVCTGAAGSGLLSGVENKERFLPLPYVSNATLRELYARCDIFFYPTLNEGFGYPPLEAMRSGKTCVVSSACSVPEICGEAALYFNPLDVGEMQTRLVQAADRHVDEERVYRRFESVYKRQMHDLGAMAHELIDPRAAAGSLRAGLGKQMVTPGIAQEEPESEA